MDSFSSRAPVSNAERVACRTRLWRWTAGNSGAWFFLTISGEAAEQIAGHALMRRLELGKTRGFGAVKVSVRIGSSCWDTSVFPSADNTWILPVKAAIRRAENLTEGSYADVELVLL
ncbi:hypothetical protein MB02_10775 [Croceicoccus estronivorus]|uniref:DUF1905 domain-containing protein n=1 Tax=Croceicoccus estronivorus TaxID=1172626 RepID=UPI000831F75A|nr:DUF1905 domain-containing protein [Croceicoccus estronivorus]OCC23642.1 hypothetical protein MB02_10775 [Croceicoccus estronivorus]